SPADQPCSFPTGDTCFRCAYKFAAAAVLWISQNVQQKKDGIGPAHHHRERPPAQLRRIGIIFLIIWSDSGLKASQHAQAPKRNTRPFPGKYREGFPGTAAAGLHWDSIFPAVAFFVRVR